MIEFLRELFSSDFMGHGYCYLWKPDIIWLHAVSDGLIALAYYVIPLALVYFVRKRRDLPFHWMFIMFGIFIFGCGTTHAMEVWTLWHGTYRLAGVIKALTAMASMATAVALVPLIPRALLLPSPGQLRAANLEMEREIAERLRAEEALRANEVQLNDAQRLARVGSWERDIEVDGLHWSDEMYRIFGTPPSNFRAFLNSVHPKDRGKILEVDDKLRSSMPPKDVEYRIIRPDGEVRFVHSIVEAIRNNQGALVRIVGATQDVTEQVQARERLRESEARLKNAERLAHVGNWHWEIKANRVTWSEELFRIFGKPEDYPPSYEGFVQAIVPQDRERLEREIRECDAGKKGHSTEFQIVRPNGDMRTVSAFPRYYWMRRAYRRTCLDIGPSFPQLSSAFYFSGFFARQYFPAARSNALHARPPGWAGSAGLIDIRSALCSATLIAIRLYDA